MLSKIIKSIEKSCCPIGRGPCKYCERITDTIKHDRTFICEECIQKEIQGEFYEEKKQEDLKNK